jgi:hypothetical protein
MSLGTQLARYRAVAGQSYPQLADRSGVAVGTINALEKRGSESSKYWGALAGALGLTYEQLADESTDYSDVVRVYMARVAAGTDGRTVMEQPGVWNVNRWPFTATQERMRASLTAEDWSRIDAYVLGIVQTREAEGMQNAA